MSAAPSEANATSSLEMLDDQPLTGTPGFTADDKIVLTTDAAVNIKELRLEYAAPTAGHRFGITGGGCSGYKYLLELEDEPQGDDLVFETDGVQVFIKAEHMEKLKNSTIDWVDSLMESGFKIDNPQAKRPCGCSESVDF